MGYVNKEFSKVDTKILLEGKREKTSSKYLRITIL